MPVLTLEAQLELSQEDFEAYQEEHNPRLLSFEEELDLITIPAQ